MTTEHHTQLLHAAQNGNAATVRHLIHLGDLKHNTQALCAAAEHGHVDCVAVNCAVRPQSPLLSSIAFGLYEQARH